MSALTDLIMHAEPLSYGATAVYAYSPSLERRYQFLSRFGEVVPLCRADGDIIHLPRALCPVGASDSRGDGRPIDVEFHGEPRPHQGKVFDETVAFLMKGQSGLVEAFTAFGKTPLSFYCIAAIKRKTLVIATKEDLFDMWIKEAKLFLGLQDHEIGVIRGPKCDVEGKKIVVAMIHSLSIGGKYPAWIADEFGLVIFDECHRVPAEQFSSVACMFNARLRLGLSATPERADGKDLLVLAHIGPVRVRTDVQLMVPSVLRFHSGWRCPRVPRRDPASGMTRVIPLPHSPGKTTHILKHLAEDETRNRLLGEIVLMGFGKGRRTVFFSDLLDHLQAMRRVLVGMGIRGRDIGAYVSCSTKAEKEQRERDKAKPVLLATYGMMKEGTNLPWLDFGVQGTPLSNVIQAVGRIRREYPGKPVPVWADMVDEDSSVFAGYAGNRLRWYRQIGASVKDL